MKNFDEDYAYGGWKQKQIDRGTTIGSALKDADKIQRMPRTDPNPSVPFVDVQAPWDSSDGLLALWAVCVVLVIGYFCYIVWG